MNPDQWLTEFASRQSQIELGLDRIKKVLNGLKLSKPLFKIITVAGTNGKGSTVHYLRSLLYLNGYSVGSFTSPHIHEFNERIEVDEQRVQNQTLINIFIKIKKYLDQENIHLTYFEYATVAAIEFFTRCDVDVAVLEVGLGGRLDATNSVSADVAIITNIGLDHQAWLGNDLESIGREKAGIIRANQPVILAEEKLPHSVTQNAKELNAKIIQYGKDYLFTIGDEDKYVKKSNSYVQVYDLQWFGSYPQHQQRNLAAAFAALDALGVSISESSLNHLSNLQLPSGRLQTIKTTEATWLLDVAHNEGSIRALLNSLLENSLVPNTGLRVVFSMLKDKDIETVVEILNPYIQHWYLSPLHSERSLTSSELGKRFESLSFTLCNNVSEACEKAVSSEYKDGPILVCGSFLTVADALQYLDGCR